MASAVPVSGSTYSYAYTTLGELIATGVAACLLLEYGVSTAAVAVGWSQYLNKLLTTCSESNSRRRSRRRPGTPNRASSNLPAILLVVMCMLLLIRGASESA